MLVVAGNGLSREGKKDAALEQMAKVSKINPTNRLVLAERYFLTGDVQAKNQLISFMGGQSEDAIQVSIFYSSPRAGKRRSRC